MFRRRWVTRIAGLGTALLPLACASPAPAPSSVSAVHLHAPVTLTYLGTAGWRLDDGAHVLLVDPYFTRANVQDGSTPLSPNQAQISRYAPDHADVILVGHSHYDHVLDVPDIAKNTGAAVVGTESTLNVARAGGVHDAHLLSARGGERFSFGPFSVQPVRGLHSLTGQPTATIPPDITLPMPADAYAEGGTLQYLVRVEGRTVFFIGTANFIESEVEGLRPEVAVLAVGLREKVPDYACRLMHALGRPHLVLTNHFDAHQKPLGPNQMDIGEDGRAGLAKFAEEIHACAPDTKVVVPTHFQPIAI